MTADANDLGAWICATCSNEDLSRPMCDNCKSDAAYEADLAAMRTALDEATARAKKAEAGLARMTEECEAYATALKVVDYDNWEGVRDVFPDRDTTGDGGGDGS